MTAARRIGTEGSATRVVLLDAAMELMVEEGYAAVTSRRVAARAGLKPQLVHYYFRTMDDLFIAMVRRGAEINRERQARALASPRPLRALWELNSDPTGTILTLELFALANHRKVIRAELAAHAEAFRRQQGDVITETLAAHDVDPELITPDAALVVLTGLSRILGLEETLGVTSGHAELRALIDRWLTRAEGEHEPPGPGDGRAPVRR